MKVQVFFEKKKRFSVGGKNCYVVGFIFEADRVCEKKSKRMRISGDGFYNWDKGEITIPPGGSVFTDPFRSNFSDWDDYFGDVPPQNGFFDFRFQALESGWEAQGGVPDFGNNIEQSKLE